MQTHYRNYFIGKIEDYNCDYSTYVQRRRTHCTSKTSCGKSTKEIEAIEQFIERFRYKASKAKQVQSRVKMLEKMDIYKKK